MHSNLIKDKIPSKISEVILTVGPNYHNHRGGIGAVIEIYSKYFEIFKFIASYKVGSSSYKSLFFIGSIIKLFKVLIFDRKIQIIHIHGASYGSFFRKLLIFLVSKYIFKKKVIYHIHGGGFANFEKESNLIVRKAIAFFIENVDVVICLSESWKNVFLENFKPKKILITHNIIDYPQLPTNKETENIITVLFLGLICDAKGIFELIEVIYRNTKKYKNKIRLIIGGNGEIDRLNNIIQQQQLEGMVEFAGWISSEEKTTWLQKADIYILPSHKEGLPISILEAMSYGQAIISTNVGGIPEIVIPERNGILIEPGNLSEIETAIDFFIEHTDKIKEYGQNSKQIAYKYLPDSVISELSTVYTSLLNHE